MPQLCSQRMPTDEVLGGGWGCGGGGKVLKKKKKKRTWARHLGWLPEEMIVSKFRPAKSSDFEVIRDKILMYLMYF